MSKALANKTIEIEQIKEEQKAVNDEYKGRIGEIRSDVKQLSNNVASGYEMRAVACDVKFHQPHEGKKTITRLDTYESWVEEMEQRDFNLFNQYQGENAGQN